MACHCKGSRGEGEMGERHRPLIEIPKDSDGEVKLSLR